MFRSAVLRLTGWYLLIIVAISIFFSTFIYFSLPREVRFGLRQGSSPSEFGVPPPGFDGGIEALRDHTAATIRQRTLVDLLEFDLVILLVGGGASYWLAQRTLRPIEEALVAQSRFTADASHELRTPLTAMRTEIEVALRDGKLTKAEAVALLKSNLEEVAKLEGLSAGLLKLAQHDGSNSEGFTEPVALTKVLHAAASRQAKSAKAHEIKVVVDPGDFRVLGEETALTDLFSILLDNAIKYSHPGGTVWIQAAPASAWVRVVVRDEGVGIKALDLPLIFSRFYRADSSRSKSTVDGYGLGLSIVHKIVVSHGGSIDVTSAPGKGSTFTVALKLDKA